MSVLLRNADDNQVVIVCHGFTGTKEGGGRAVEMGDALAMRGYSTLLFDFTGCGESEGDFQDISLTGQLDDLDSVAAWCRSKGYKRLILNGRSFGGTTVFKYAALNKDISAVCTWAAVARVRDLFHNYSGGVEISGPEDEIVIIEGEEGTVHLKKRFFYDLRKHDLIESASLLDSCRLLIIHGSDDQSVPLEDACLLYQAASVPKKLAIIEGADHRFTNHIEQVWETFFEWLDSEPGGLQ